MRCPDSIAEILSRIVKQGVLQTRAAAWSGDSELCAVLMDHIHNLPELLIEFSEERLQYYWEVERPAFVTSVEADATAPYAELWDELHSHVQLGTPTTSGT